MRIAQITPLYYPYIGGVETVVKNISEEMVKQGHQVEILTIDPSRKLPEIEKYNGVYIRRFALTANYYFSLPLYTYLKNKANLYTLVHAHNLHSFVPYISSKAILGNVNNRPKLIITGHYHGRGKTPLTTLFLLCYRSAIKKFLIQADGITCVSHFESNLIKCHFNVPKEKIIVIPNGVEITEIIKAKKNCKDNNKYILIVGRLEKYKNVHLAIGALPYLPKNINLVMIGDGPYKKELRQLVNKLNLNNRVKMLGRLTNEEVYSWYQSCQLVLNFSDLEAFGLTVIEGLSAGKPALVNNRSALVEFSNNFDGVKSIDVLNMDPKALAKEIENCIGLTFPAPSLEKYRWPSISNMLLNYYDAI